MVKVKSIIYTSQDRREAEVIISDGIYELLCFSYPCKVTEQQTIYGICSINAAYIMRADDNNYSIEKLKHYFDYKITAKLIDVVKKIAQIGHILIYVDNAIPKDIKEGEFISFICSRLDICNYLL